jgi:glyoxylase-like metal-dependent hydrolase (beta-lactamase superfamily II)
MSGYENLAEKETILATIYSASPDGLRDGIKHVTEDGSGTIFTVSGHDMSEFDFVLSKDGEHLIAIDSGSREDTLEAAYLFFRNHLRLRGSPDPPPLTTVIFTHAHWDHIGGHSFYRRLNPRARFYARANYNAERGRCEHQVPPYRWFLGTEFRRENVGDFRPDVLIDMDSTIGKEGLVVGGTRFEFKLIEGGGGETPDGMFIYLPDQGVLFAGDFIVPWLGAPYVAEGDVGSLFAAIDWITEEVKPGRILYGHEALTLFYSKWETLKRFRPHLEWLHRETLAHIYANKTLSEIQGLNLYPPSIVGADQADVQLPYLIMREVMINRIYRQNTGYWGPQLTGVDYLGPDEIGSVFKRYLRLSEAELASAVARMIESGDHELGGKVADWSLRHFPDSDLLRNARRAAYRKLKEKWQSLNVFKFVMYSEHINDATHQVTFDEGPPAPPRLPG